MRRGGEARVALAAAAASCDDKSIAGRGEIMQHLAGFPIVDDGAHGRGNVDRCAFAALAVAAFAVAAPLGLVFGVETEVQEGIVMLAGDQDHIAALASVAAAGPAARNEFLAPEGETAVAAVAGFDRNYDLIDKHVGGNRSITVAARKRLRKLFGGFDADELACPAAVAEFDDARDLGE